MPKLVVPSVFIDNELVVGAVPNNAAIDERSIFVKCRTNYRNPKNKYGVNYQPLMKNDCFYLYCVALSKGNIYCNGASPKYIKEVVL